MVNGPRECNGLREGNGPPHLETSGTRDAADVSGVVDATHRLVEARVEFLVAANVADVDRRDGVDAASTVAGLSGRTSPTNEVLGAEREALDPWVARFLR